MYRILLVEDDAALRYVYTRIKVWEEYGFVIAAEASNGKEALEILERESFNIVMTDIRMPFVDGLTLLSEIKARKIDVFSILVSSYNEFEYARQGLILGAFDFIVKPVNAEKLADVLERARIYLSEKEEEQHIDKLILSAAEGMNIIISGNSFLTRLCLFLSGNMNRCITMDEAAEHMGLSKDYFGKTFKQNTDISFSAFYSVIKTENAKLLIDSGKYKIYEISDKLGYSDSNYFTRIFKEATGMTPAAYKKRNTDS